VGEGSYRFWFEADGVAGGRSLETSLRVDFDNAAPAAAIRAPAAWSRRAASVHVAGVALRGSSVSVGGRVLALDGHDRFEADLGAPADEDAVAIRIAHPERGVHYFLRRAARP
jgi:hypothetical protein